MDKTVKVAIERQVRDPLYGKTQKRTSTFLAHDEKNEAKIGDRSRSPRRRRSAPASAGW
jgi:small subunit ribosomal protein S17